MAVNGKNLQKKKRQMIKFLKLKGSQLSSGPADTRVIWGFVAGADFQISSYAFYALKAQLSK